MIYHTLTAPHGTPLRPGASKEWVCPKCFESFEALFSYLEHQTKVHRERRGMAG